MRHRHVNNRRTFGLLLNRTAQAAQESAGSQGHGLSEEPVSVETAKRRHALKHGVPTSYWRLRHHHGYVISRPA